jgi:hypothetical protein
MPRTPHPSLKTYEAFLEGMAKESDETKRYYYKQIMWAEKEYERHAIKGKKRRDYIRTLMAANKPPAVPAEKLPAEPGSSV